MLSYTLSISQFWKFIIYACCLFFITEKSCHELQANLDDTRTNNPTNQPILSYKANEKSERCCSRNGICSHEVLRDGNPDSDSKMVRKVYFKSLIEAKWVIIIILLLLGFLMILWNICVCLCGFVYVFYHFVDSPFVWGSIEYIVCRIAQSFELYAIILKWELGMLILEQCYGNYC